MKRQKAEQNFHTLQQDMRSLETAHKKMSAKLEAIDGSDVPDGLRILAHQCGHVQMLISEIAEQSHLILSTKMELDFARDHLKRAIYSQDRV